METRGGWTGGAAATPLNRHCLPGLWGYYKWNTHSKNQRPTFPPVTAAAAALAAAAAAERCRWRCGTYPVFTRRPWSITVSRLCSDCRVNKRLLLKQIAVGSQMDLFYPSDLMTPPQPPSLPGTFPTAQRCSDSGSRARRRIHHRKKTQWGGCRWKRRSGGGSISISGGGGAWSMETPNDGSSGGGGGVGAHD